MMKEWWYVLGDPDSLHPKMFGTKIEAEAHARKCFPHEDVAKRYARVMLRKISFGEMK